jgi:uncharacterized protein YndB with AHSA1/START domain
MSVTSITDTQNLTLTMTAELDAPRERVWQLWADPRQFERWWGAPGYPATATALDLRTGGTVEFHLTGPDGEMPKNVWDVVQADPPEKLVLRDAIVDDNDVPTDEGPTSFTITFDQLAAGRTRMSILSKFPNTQALQAALDMDMDKGLEWNVSQMELILAESKVAA